MPPHGCIHTSLVTNDHFTKTPSLAEKHLCASCRVLGIGPDVNGLVVSRMFGSVFGWEKVASDCEGGGGCQSFVGAQRKGRCRGEGGLFPKRAGSQARFSLTECPPLLFSMGPPG